MKVINLPNRPLIRFLTILKKGIGILRMLIVFEICDVNESRGFSVPQLIDIVFAL